MAKLTKRDRETLRDLYSQRDNELPGKVEVGWARPMDVGGRDGSHHSQTLAKLVKKGLAERSVRGGHTKDCYQYRITTLGEEAVKKKR